MEFKWTKKQEIDNFGLFAIKTDTMVWEYTVDG